jgi:hypothetical protein
VPFEGGPVRAGDDRLVSGINAPDLMWGDFAESNIIFTPGADTFVFAGAFGNDTVYDFRTSDGDKIEIDLAEGEIWSEQVTWTAVGTDLVMTVDSDSSSGTITFVGMSDWTPAASDFLFV